MLKKLLLPTVVISGTLLAGFGVLLATQGSKPIEIQFDNRQFFYGELRHVVSPPIGALISIGVGLATTSLIGWQQAKKRTQALQTQVSQLQSQILDRDSQIQELKVAPSSPMLSKLDWFLDRQVSQTSVLASSVLAPLQLPPVQPVTEPVVTTVSGFDYQVITTNQLSNQPSVQTAASAFPSAQSVLGLTQRYGKAAPPTTPTSIK
jgi:hypothetical protein